ncbi:hypothetical protein HW555_013377 [Spodoptera exigua]|uniref:Uncharacterized protein n=1 Tax=Spodoptera exigua TaxID=7107 RepID=A0A835G1T5_SPOEX|nr:hypothetical protein HW555_013377 [Spodoptera exigua]
MAPMATAFCCFRDPYMLPTTPCTNMCGCSANIGPTCECGTSCNCFRDLSNVCNVCDQQPSPVCQCLNKCGCDSKYPLYFPEVEYPLTILEIDTMEIVKADYGCSKSVANVIRLASLGVAGLLQERMCRISAYKSLNIDPRDIIIHHFNNPPNVHMLDIVSQNLPHYLPRLAEGRKYQ